MMMDWVSEANAETQKHNEILSFNDYMDIYNEHYYRESRPTYQYLLDMIQHFGKDELGNYKVFTQKHNNAPAVWGQQKIQESLVQNLKNFQEEGFNNKFILLVGPNGSSKSSIVRKLMIGAEEYSNVEEGSLYTFSWVFPIDAISKGTLGFATSSDRANSENNTSTYAYLEDKDVSAILTSELKDHPLLLIPREFRQKILEDKFADKPDFLDSLRKSYLYLGDLSKRNRMIYDALLKNYKGKHSEVLKHIRIERFHLSKRYSTGAVTIEPQIHVDARMQQITMDKRLASLPPSLQSLNLFSLQGETVMANRGILEYSDLLKRPLDSYKYLLQTMETGNLNLGGIQTELDIFFIGTSNEIHLAAFKQHPDFNSFKGRFNFIRVPYLLNYREEEKIYLEQVTGLKEHSTFEPHALRAICLFAVMTRLRSSLVKNYEDKKLANIATSLNPLEKVLFLSEKEVPERLDSESSQILLQGYNEISSEFEYDNLYQGKFGISPRDVKNIIYKLSSRFKNVSFVEVIEYLQKFITKKNEFDFLNMTPQADYHHPARFIAHVKSFCLDICDKEVRDSLGLIDDRSYEDYISRYILTVKAMIKKERIKNPITGQYETNNDYIINEFEKAVALKEDKDKFRSHLISKLGAYSLDNPGKTIVYTEVFPDLVKRLKESFRQEQKKVIQTISQNIVFYEAELVDKDKRRSTPLSQENRDQIEQIIDNLQKRYGYSQLGAINTLKFLIKERY